MSHLTLVHWKSIGGTLAMRQSNLNYAEEIEIGATNGKDEGLTNDSECIALIAKSNSEANKFYIASMIVFKHHATMRMSWISQSWTAKRYRRQGLHERLFNKLLKLSRKAGSLSICSNISVGNYAMIEAAKKQGRKLDMLRFEMKL